MATLVRNVPFPALIATFSDLKSFFTFLSTMKAVKRLTVFTNLYTNTCRAFFKQMMNILPRWATSFRKGKRYESATADFCSPETQVLLPANVVPTEAPSPGVCEAPGNQAPQVAVVLLLGLDGAGKTTLLGTLQGEKDPRVRPSVGFTLVTMMLSDQLKVTPGRTWESDAVTSYISSVQSDATQPFCVARSNKAR